jgi:uncharacterized membrane protein YhiD involved in acid resistance
MQAIGDNLARGLGMLGALSIIRFRTVFKDPRDIIFMFAAMAAGISCGVFGYGIAVVGTTAFCAAAFLLYHTPFGEQRFYDGMLRFNLAAESDHRATVEETLREHCRQFALITLRESAQGTRLDFAYHIKLRKGKSREDLVRKIRDLDTVKDASLLLQETTVEL